jgi:oxygen-independent coproporphyrinogen-3 oxidase
VLSDLPEVAELIDAGLVERLDSQFVPTPAGLERSDAIGPWLYSDAVRRTMSTFDLH